MAWILQLYDPKRPQSVDHVAPFTSFEINYGATGGVGVEFRRTNGSPLDITSATALSLCVQDQYNAGSRDWLTATQALNLTVDPPNVAFEVTAQNGGLVADLVTVTDAAAGKLTLHIENYWTSLPKPFMGRYATLAAEWLLQFPNVAEVDGGYVDTPVCYKFWSFLHIRGSNR